MQLWWHLTLPTRKILGALFSATIKVFLIYFVERGIGIIAEEYCKTLNKLKLAIQSKRCGGVTCTVIILLDKVRRHTADRTTGLLLLLLETMARRLTFWTRQRTQERRFKVLHSQLVNFDVESLEKLMQRWKKYLQVSGH